ncbi:hypothetical protein TrRE_jg13608, partial [Triparma retinervis]
MRVLFLVAIWSLFVRVTSEDGALDRIITRDDETRARFGSMKEEREAREIVGDLKDIVDEYSSMRRYQRALALVEVAKPPTLPPPFYAFMLAEVEARLLSCYQDFNEAVYILHFARDNLLKYLGMMEKSELARHMDVWEAVFAITSKLISWYAHTSSPTGEGVTFLIDWMVESGPYRSKMQLPAYFQPELPMNPWPEWDEWEGLGMGRVRATLLRFQEEMKAEMVGDGEVAKQLEAGFHDTECLVDMTGGVGVGGGAEYKRIIYREEDCRVEEVGGGGEGEERVGEGVEEGMEEGGEEGGEEEKFEEEEPPVHPLSICNAYNDIKEGYSITALSYNTLSKGAKTMGHFGTTNRDWQAIIPISNPGCLKIVVHRSEARPQQGE